MDYKKLIDNFIFCVIFLAQTFISIRRAIKARGSATRAEIASDTKIIPTTIRSLLSEMIQNSEIESMGYDESSGSRKATRYCLNSERYHSVAFCITDNQIHGLLVNVYGEILETSLLKPALNEDDYEPAITAFIGKVIAQKEIRSVGIGVPLNRGRQLLPEKKQHKR